MVGPMAPSPRGFLIMFLVVLACGFGLGRCTGSCGYGLHISVTKPDGGGR